MNTSKMTSNFKPTIRSHETITNTTQSNVDQTDRIWNFEKRERQKIKISIPNVLVRKFTDANRAYLVYQIHIQISTKPDPNLSMPSPNIEWNVYHRYTTLSRLHSDLAGQLIEDLGSNSNIPDGPNLAHECLPRPLPGIGLLKFPSKHLVPSVPKLVRHKECIRKGAENDLSYEDYPICLNSYSRFETRRRKLETYLQNLVALIWHLTEDCDDVADVYRSMVTPRPDATGADQMNSDFLVSGWFELEQIHKKLLRLLPILEP